MPRADRTLYTSARDDSSLVVHDIPDHRSWARECVSAPGPVKVGFNTQRKPQTVAAQCVANDSAACAIALAGAGIKSQSNSFDAWISM